MSIRFLLLLALFQTLACSQSMSRCDQALDTCDDAIDRFPEENRISIKYANKTIPKIEYFKNFVDVDISFDEDTPTRYRFVVCGCEVDQVEGRTTIFINPLSLYIDTGPTLALYHLLAPDNLAAITLVAKLDNIFNQDIRDHITSGGAVETSIQDEKGNPATNFSKIEEVDPSLSIVDTFGFDAYRTANIDVPFIVNAEAQEQNPLARAEWIKIIGLVLDRVENANEEFAEIEKNYKEARERAEGAVRRPAVFFNTPFDGMWTLPVADEYITQLVRDANADYRYADEKPVAGQSGTFVNISTVVRDFASADVLLQSSHFPLSDNSTLEDYLQGYEGEGDPEGLRAEIEKLKAVRCATVWSSSKRVTKDGLASDIFELGIVRPDLFLLDIIKALHPNLDFEDRETFFIYRYEAAGDTRENCPNTALNGTPPEGQEFVDTKFVVPSLDRYEIADRLEESVIPEIEKRVNGPFEVFFHHEDVSENDTVVTVRVQVNSTEKESFEEEPSVIFALRETLGDDVRDVSQTNEDDGGLSGGAIAGIVIGVVAVVLVVGFLVSKRRAKGRVPVPVDGMGGFDQDITV